jgi:hypothetical protein
VATDADRDGRLPLHILLDMPPSMPLASVAAELCRLHAGSTKIRDPHLDLPFHKALSNQWSDDCALAVLECFPQAASEAAPDGRLPLALALAHNASFSVVRAVLFAHEPAIKIPVNHSSGQLPLHYALASRCDDQRETRGVAKLLLEAAPHVAKKKVWRDQ